MADTKKEKQGIRQSFATITDHADHVRVELFVPRPSYGTEQAEGISHGRPSHVYQSINGMLVCVKKDCSCNDSLLGHGFSSVEH